MSQPHDELAELLRDARAHASWLDDAGERTVLRSSVPVQLPKPSARGASAPAQSRAAMNAPAAMVAASAQPGRTLEQIRAELGDCKRCKLCEKRKKIVFGVGNPNAELVFVGEGPGENEDLQGEPFVGAAGDLLTRMIENGMGLRREQVYICNVVKCRPPGNRNPEPDEIAQCEPFLSAQLDAIKPKVIVALGKFAAQTLLRETTAISRLRGTWRTYRGIKLMPTFHPSYLLRSPEEKGKAWADLQLVMKELGLTRPPR